MSRADFGPVRAGPGCRPRERGDGRGVPPRTRGAPRPGHRGWGRAADPGGGRVGRARVEIGPDIAVGWRNDRRGPAHHMVAGEHGVFLVQCEAQVVADVPGGVQRLDGVPGAVDDVAVGECRLRIEVDVGCVLPLELRVVLDLRPCVSSVSPSLHPHHRCRRRDPRPRRGPYRGGVRTRAQVRRLHRIVLLLQGNGRRECG